MMVGDQCWHVREGQPAAARSSATRSTSPAKNTTSSKPPLARQDCSVYPVVVLAPPGPGPGRRQTASARWAIGTPWPCHDSYLYRIRVRSERLVGLTGSVAA
jgi:hypothetical protein